MPVDAKEIECGEELLDERGKFVDLDIRQPTIKDEGLGRRVLKIRQSLGGPANFPYLPAHGDEGRA